MPRTLRKPSAWLAIIAMALQAFWPLVAQAKPSDPGLLVPICSIDGVTHYVDLTPGRAPLEKRAAIHHEHCQYCVFGGDRAAVVPPPALAALVIPAASTEAPAPPAVAVSEKPPYPPAHPRAPPVLS